MRNKKEAEWGNESMRIEVYGSLLNSKEREKAPLEKGMMIELGKQERIGWKLSFDKLNRREEAVLNLVWTGNKNDAYYTTVFQIDTVACGAIMEREMGMTNAEEWKQGLAVKFGSYRPFTLASEFGNTEVFIIPCEERKRIPTNREARYFKTVKEGIEESYKDIPHMKAKNLDCLEKAVDESIK